MDFIFKAHLFLSLYMLGLIWFVQVVHYPLMGQLSGAAFVAYERLHTRLTTWVTGPPMLVELGTGLWLLAALPGSSLAWLNMAGIGLLWGSTFFVQVPLHTALSQVFDAELHRRLVRGNWLRTWVWTGRALLLWVWMGSWS